jgi:hypothetical protein
MPLYSVKTGKSPDQVIEQAKGYFGEEGVGLEMTEDAPCCVTFVGGGGHVSVTVSEVEGKTEVELATREWDYDVKRFMNKV